MDTPVDAQAVINHLTTQIGQLSYDLAVKNALIAQMQAAVGNTPDKEPVHTITDMPV